MQGKKLFLDQEVTRFRLSERVPPHTLYRRLADLVDWSFLYDAPCCSRPWPITSKSS
jgi:hypothetical protein